MRGVLLTLVLLSLPASGKSTELHIAGVVPDAANAQALGPSHGVLLEPADRDPCGTVVMNSDGTYESAYTWAFDGNIPPYYGAFAECYGGSCAICSIVLDLTASGYGGESLVDIYVWDDEAGILGAVRCARIGMMTGPIGFWPLVTRHYLQLLSPCCTGDAWWVGHWGEWPWTGSDHWIGADRDGPGGCPYTNIAPGLGYPSGWQNVSVVPEFGATAAMGLGAEVIECPPVPVLGSTWGWIKSLYQR